MLLALLSATLIGLTLGVLGSGGSILTVPVLTYLVGEPGKVAIAEGLAIVALIALVSSAAYLRERAVDGRSVALFGGPGLVGAYAGAALSAHVPGAMQLVLFAAVMLLAAAMMVRGRADARADAPARPAVLVAAAGLGVGLLTGLIGVGGGFLIVPALVLLVGLDMRRAVGTSLVVIALNGAVGFARSLGVLDAAGLSVDARLIAVFAAVGAVGALAGGVLARRIPQARLRQSFAVFLVAMGVFILYQELPAVLT
jgi:uncharacterized protein